MADVSFYQNNNSKEVARRRKMAQALAQQGQQNSGTEVVSGYAVPKSPLEGLAKGLATGIGAYQDRRADAMEVDLDKKRAELMAQAVGAYRNDPVAASQILMQDPEMSEAAMKMGLSGIDAEREAQAREMDFQRKADLQRELMGMRQSGTSAGGATGALVQQYMESTGADFPSALYAVQTGMRQGTRYNNGSIAPIAGYAEAKGLTERQTGYMGEQGKEQAKYDVQNARNAPKVSAESQVLLDTIQGIKDDKGLGAVVGVPNPFQGGFGVFNIPGSPAANFQAKIEQLGGKQFLQAFETLKGGGQITEVEGKKATNAIARMQTSQSEKAFIEALDEFSGIVRDAANRASASAGQSAINLQNPYSAAPAGQPPVQETPFQKLMRLRAEAANRGGGQ